MPTILTQSKYPPGFRARRGLNWGVLGLMYASYYMCRYNFRFATPGMVEEFHFNTFQITSILSAWSVAYGFGQLLEMQWPEHPNFPNYGYTITRHDLDGLVAERAVKAGASLLAGTEVVAPIIDEAARPSSPLTPTRLSAASCSITPTPTPLPYRRASPCMSPPARRR